MTGLNALVRAAASGDEHAWSELSQAILPSIRSIITSHRDLRSRGLARLDDDIAEITTACFERLARNDKRNLVRYLEQLDSAGVDHAQDFESWLYGAVDFTIRDHLRQRYGRAPKSVAGEESALQPAKRDLGTGAHELDEQRLPVSLSRALGVTTQLSLMEISSYINAEFSPDEVLALQLHYVEELAHTELAERLGLADEPEAQRLIRRLNARLRYRFGHGE